MHALTHTQTLTVLRVPDIAVPSVHTISHTPIDVLQERLGTVPCPEEHSPSHKVKTLVLPSASWATAATQAAKQKSNLLLQPAWKAVDLLSCSLRQFALCRVQTCWQWFLSVFQRRNRACSPSEGEACCSFHSPESLLSLWQNALVFSTEIVCARTSW